VATAIFTEVETVFLPVMRRALSYAGHADRRTLAARVTRLRRIAGARAPAAAEDL
jgi:hypothetical protein